MLIFGLDTVLLKTDSHFSTVSFRFIEALDPPGERQISSYATGLPIFVLHTVRYLGPFPGPLHCLISDTRDGGLA